MHPRRFGGPVQLEIDKRGAHTGAKPQRPYELSVEKVEYEEPPVNIRTVSRTLLNPNHYLRNSISSKVSAFETVHRMGNLPSVQGIRSAQMQDNVQTVTETLEFYPAP